MTGVVKRSPVRTLDATSSPTSTRTAGRAKPLPSTGATADAVSGSSVIGAKPVRTKALAEPARTAPAVTAERPNYTVTPPSPRGTVTADSRSIRMPGVPTGPDSDLSPNGYRRGIANDGGRPVPGSLQTTASTSDVVDGIADGRKLFIEDAEDGGGVTAQEGLGEAAEAIERGSKSAADALQDAMPHLDDAGADELAKLMKTAAAAKGVSVAALVLSVGDVAMNWKNHGLDDERTQDSLAGLVGGTAGSAIGMALAGPLGAALGGMVGSYLGPKVAEFARDLADKYGDDVKDAVKAMEDGIKEVGDSIANAADAFGNFMSDMWGKVWGDGGLIDGITPDLPDVDMPDIDIPFF